MGILVMHGGWSQPTPNEDPMLKEHEYAVLLRDLPEFGLITGDVGTVVHVYGDQEGCEMEFTDIDGRTIAVVTVGASELRVLRAGERAIPHLRSA